MARYGKESFILRNGDHKMLVKNILKKLDLEKIESFIKEGYITRGIHPSGDLFIYNYSQKTMYEGYWTDETLQCRGLIADVEGNIVARPFPKFFNYEEHQGNLPNEPFEVYEKLDGSLGILYFYKDKPYIATRGSFDSEQAKVANEMLNTYNINILNKNYTYLFEIIYPENRIVVNYKDKKQLFLISTIETRTGKEIIHHEGNYFPNVKRYDEHEYIPINLLSELEKPNQEGFVIRFQSGLRIKIKFKDYVRLHSIVTQITKKKVWEVIKDNKNFDEFIGNIPDELFSWIKKTESELREDHDTIEKTSLMFLKKVIVPYRKKIAKEIVDNPYASVMFSMLDNKDFHKVIWSMLEPKHEIPIIKAQE